MDEIYKIKELTRINKIFSVFNVDIIGDIYQINKLWAKLK